MRGATSAGRMRSWSCRIPDPQRAMAEGRTTSEQLVKAYLARIEAIDRSGPTLRSVIAVNPNALAEARALDAERRAGHVRGPLHGVPILIKDNIETADPIPTTAGSLALKTTSRAGTRPGRAAARGGAVILGKTNLSEWANIRSDRSISGWSAVGGLVKNPYALDRNACGSSSGSGAAAAASLAAAAIGTETDGSVICPSSFNGLVGLKPTVGLVSRTFVVPISHSQDTAGPMARSVEDVALLLTAMAGSDPKDPATAEADAHKADYARALDREALKGKRIGVMRPRDMNDPAVTAAFDKALAELKAGGRRARRGDRPVEDRGHDRQGRAGGAADRAEGRHRGYLASTPPSVKARTLADLIAFDAANAGAEAPFFGQELFEAAQKTKGLDDADYVKARDEARRLAGAEGLDKVMLDNRLDAIVAPTARPGLAHGRGRRRPRRRLGGDPAGGGGLSAPDRTDGAGARPADRAVLHRAGVVGGRAAVAGLRLRTAHAPAGGADVPRVGGVGPGRRGASGCRPVT